MLSNSIDLVYRFIYIQIGRIGVIHKIQNWLMLIWLKISDFFIFFNDFRFSKNGKLKQLNKHTRPGRPFSRELLQIQLEIQGAHSIDTRLPPHPPSSIPQTHHPQKHSYTLHRQKNYYQKIYNNNSTLSSINTIRTQIIQNNQYNKTYTDQISHAHIYIYNI